MDHRAAESSPDSRQQEEMEEEEGDLNWHWTKEQLLEENEFLYHQLKSRQDEEEKRQKLEKRLNPPFPHILPAPSFRSDRILLKSMVSEASLKVVNMESDLSKLKLDLKKILDLAVSVDNVVFFHAEILSGGQAGEVEENEVEQVHSQNRPAHNDGEVEEERTGGGVNQDQSEVADGAVEAEDEETGQEQNPMPPNDLSTTGPVVTPTAAVRNPKPTSSSSSEPQRATTAAAIAVETEPILNENFQESTPRVKTHNYNTRFSSKNISPIVKLASTPYSYSSPSSSVSESSSSQSQIYYDEDTSSNSSSNNLLSSPRARRVPGKKAPSSSKNISFSFRATSTPYSFDNSKAIKKKKTPPSKTYNIRASSKNIASKSTSFTPTSAKKPSKKSTSTSRHNEVTILSTSTIPLSSFLRAKRLARRKELKITPASEHPRRSGNYSSVTPYVPRFSKIKKRVQKAHAVDETKMGQGFYCVCERSFANQGRLTEHIRYFNGDPKFQCEKCPLRFTALSVMKKHMETCHKIKITGKTIGCGDCGAVFEKREDWKAHRLAMHIKNDASRSLDHAPDESDESGCKCICGKYFTSKRNLNSHIRNYMNFHDFKCPYCVRTFKSVARVQGHSKAVHKKLAFEKGTTGCVICGELFTVRKEHVQHMDKAHGVNCRPKSLSEDHAHGPQPMSMKSIKGNPSRSQHRCLCGAAFQNKNLLTMHIRRKKDRVTFKCPYCTVEFAVHTRLTKHIIKIHKKKDYKASGCGKCGMTFPTRVALRRHGDTVHGRRGGRPGPRPSTSRKSKN